MIKKAAPKLKKAAPKTPPITVNPEVWESLWRVVDAARYAVSPAHGQPLEDALEFLADQEKMLRRAIGFFHGPPDSAEDELRETHATKHPYIKELEMTRVERVSRGYARSTTHDPSATFSELGMGPTAERK